MKEIKNNEEPNELDVLCSSVKALAVNGEYETCFKMAYAAMENYPHAPHPHNLAGILLEKTGDHLGAMKHFRAAWALDPAYRPANVNLQTYGTFYSSGAAAFDESDCPSEEPKKAQLQ